jgi:uncharacterized protein YxjI
MYNYPLTLTFKVITLGPQITVTDASGRVVMFVKMKFMKLKEEVTIYADVQQTQKLFSINADRIIDFSARYSFTDSRGMSLGAIRRQGMKSLWRARYDIFEVGETPVMNIEEESVATRFADGCLTSIPIVGMFAGYFFHPAFLVSRPDGNVVMRIQKQPAFFEGKFTIEKLAAVSDLEENRVLLSMLMMTLLERQRG